MYKIFIVDDEMLARVGIKSLISWEENGYVIEGEAENGEQAYDWIVHNPVDIVITDIKMPVMDGIQLIKKVNEQRSDIKFIVLSSYDDFEYVREALKSGAFDYMIKLELTPDSLLQQLKKAAESLKSNRDVYLQELSPVPNKSREYLLMKEAFFRDLLYGWIKEEGEYARRSNELSIIVPVGKIVCLMLRTDDLEINNRYDDDEIHLLNQSILNMLYEVRSEHGDSYAISPQNKEIVILYFVGTENSNEAIQKAEGLAGAIRHTLHQYFSMDVSIGISEAVEGFAEIKQAYRQLNQMLSQRFDRQDAKIIHFHMFNKLLERADKIDLSQELNELMRAIGLCEDENAYDILIELKEILFYKNVYTLEMIQVYCSRILYLIMSRLGENSTAWLEKQMLQLNKSSSKNELLVWFDTMKEKWMTDIKGETKISRTIQMAKSFIASQYSNELTLENMAEYLNLTPSYFSNLFKKETGVNFIEYVTKVRVEQAQYLLRTTDLKIYEISREVGYENEHYFSRVFKKVTGASPLRYKNHSESS